MPLPEDNLQLLQQLALWLIPGHNQRRLVQGFLQQEPKRSLTEFTASAALELLASNPAFKPNLRQLAQVALHDPWRLPFASKLEENLRWAEAPEHWLLFLADLPPALQELANPPLLLAVKGAAAELFAPAIAMVGSRNLSPEGEHLANNWAYQLTWQGLNLISGLARGIDAQAHWGALRAVAEGAPATSCAVLAQGLDSVYPPEHKNLAANLITAGGALISEYPLGTAPIARHFPARNRLVTGLSLGVVVVEATLRSGSLVSARHAMEQGREVMAVPGSVRRQQSAGCHQLIRQGAALVTSPEEVLQELSQPLQQLLLSGTAASSTAAKTAVVALAQPELTPVAAQQQPHLAVPEHLQQVYALVHDAPQPSDKLLSQLGLSAAEGLVLLLELELDGWITQQPGGWVLSAR